MNIPREPVERRAWINFQLRRRGLSLAAIARQEGVCQQAVSAALLQPSFRIEKAIAAAIDLTPEELFPERFGPRGRLSAIKVRPAASRNVQREDAA